MKVWMVVTNSWPEWSVDGVFSGVKSAEQFAAQLRKTTPRKIEVHEFELDAHAGKKARKVYECSVRMKGHGIKPTRTVIEIADRDYVSVSVGAKTLDVRSAVSKKHALSLAKEKRKEMRSQSST